MNWYRSPQVIERLAAAYALGTLAGPARRRFEAVVQAHPQVARAVADWDARLEPMAQRLSPLPASDALWGRIEQRAFGTAAAARPALSWWQRLLAPLPAGALAFGLALGLLPTMWPLLRPDAADTQLPDSYVGVLATPQGRTGMIVSSLRHGRAMDLKQPQPLAVPAGQTLYVWTIDAAGAVRPVGPAPSGAFVQVALPQPAETLFATAVELGVSVEPQGSTPVAPSGAFVYRGLCGKLWRVRPAT